MMITMMMMMMTVHE